MENLKGLKVAVLATDGFEESELLEPVRALREANAEVTILSPKTGEIQGVKHLQMGQRIKVDKKLTEGMGEYFDAVLLPGGAVNADQLRVEPAVKSFLQSMEKAKKPIAAICHAPWALISAGIVKGRTLTSYFTIQDDIQNAGALWRDEEVVSDGNWVTSRQPKDIPAFTRELLKLFANAPRPSHAR